MIQIKNVRKSFGNLEVLKDISLHVKRGETAVFIGVSGSGKTTLLRCINYLEEYDEGEIIVDGKLIGRKRLTDNTMIRSSESEIANSRMEIGMVFQNYNLFPHLSALENVMLAPVKVKGIAKGEARNLSEELLDKVGLLEKKNEFPTRLSGGQQQRVAIARALAMRPKVLLLDEVTAALDPELVEEVLQVIAELAREGMTMVIVTHEMSFAMDVGSEVYFLDEGIIKEKGDANKILINPMDEKLRRFLKRFSTGYRMDSE